MFTDSAGSRWYKGNLHTHTTASDGVLTPEECAERKKRLRLFDLIECPAAGDRIRGFIGTLL